MFLLYLIGSYGRSTMAGDLAAWARFGANGWVAGDRVGNASLAVHVLVAAIVLVTGALQLLPVLRTRAPAVHRWSGRVYLSACFVGAASGLTLVWGRGTVGDLAQHVAISINALLLSGCAIMAWRTARARQFAAHRDWALRAYLVAGGVFYFRLLLALWLIVWRRPVGFDPATFTGPFLTVLAFAVYVFAPLLCYEGYRRALRREHRVTVAGMAAATWVLTLISAAGVVAATVVLWVPKLRG
jgi:uncharacterized membrane protein